MEKPNHSGQPMPGDRSLFTRDSVANLGWPLRCRCPGCPVSSRATVSDLGSRSEIALGFEFLEACAEQRIESLLAAIPRLKRCRRMVT